ncbi:MAG: HDOD domain-containing protein [Verrucomicrobiota bacterium]
MPGNQRILVVQTEPEFGVGSTALAHPETSHWQWEFVPNPEAALTTLEQGNVEMVIADFAETRDAGIAFLDQVWKQHPSTARFLLVENPTHDEVMKCVMGAHQLLSKPLDGERLKAALDRAAGVSTLVRSERIKQVVSRMRTFPALPTSYFEVMKELSSAHASPERLGQLIGRDLAMTTKLIQMVNSAAGGAARPITDPAQAILLLGMQTVRSLVLSVHAFAQFDKVKPLYFSIDKVWRHSLAVASTAKQIAQEITGDESIAHEAYTAGLLHDLGKLVLAANFENDYGRVLTVSRQQSVPVTQIEREIFGATHAEIGAYLLCHWGMPLSVIEATAGHHLPAAALGKIFSPIAAVHLANALEYEVHPGHSGFPEHPQELDYPDELGLKARLRRWRDIAMGQAPGLTHDPSPATILIRKPEVASINTPPPADALIPNEAAFFQTITVVCVLVGIGLTIGALLIHGLHETTKAAPEKPPEIGNPHHETGGNADAPNKDASPATTEMQPRTLEPTVSVPRSDPTAENQAATFPKLKLHGIIFRGASSSALINGKSLQAGQEIDGVRILEIARQSVTIEWAGVQKTVNMPGLETRPSRK